MRNDWKSSADLPIALDIVVHIGRQRLNLWMEQNHAQALLALLYEDERKISG